jgi:2-polyprenyl-3-methyl-5-hydroxy-6-metoxy-1,4-benzoquinol methylase
MRVQVPPSAQFKIMKIHDWIYRTNPRARWLAKELILSCKEGASLLNIGAGDGHLEKELGKSNFEITSLEPTQNKNLKNQILQTFENAKFENKFDVIIFSYSFHHLDNPIESLKKALSLIKDDGKIFLLELAPDSNLGKILLFKSRIICQTRKHTWTKSELGKIIISAGGKILESKKYSSVGVMYIIEK